MTVQADILKAIEGIEHGFQQAGQALSERIFHCRQVHGAEIVDARSLSESGRHAADGVFSEGPLAVAVVTADCLPILMSSRDGRVVAALHGGWQGLVDRYRRRGGGALQCARRRQRGHPGRHRSRDQSLLLRGECRVHRGVAGRPRPPLGRRGASLEPASSAPRAAAPVRSARAKAGGGRGAWLDLVAFCRQLFQAAGVGPAQIEASAVCTYCSGDAFASHRRRQRLGEEKRQQYAWIARKP